MSLLHERNSIAMASGSLSTCSSMLMAVMIPRARGGLTTPYRRIIFGLSVSDVIQSVGIMLGPFFVPSDHEESSGSSWAIGNVHTCDFQGFIFTFGATTTCMYTLFLCLYYYCKLKRNMNDSTFKKKIETKIHSLIVLFNAIVCLIALATKTYNPLSESGSCQQAKKPHGCDPNVPGSCERGHLSIYFQILYFPVAVPCLCLIGMLIFMFSIVIHVYKRDRLFRSNRMEQNDVEEQETEVDYVARLLRREVTLQVVLYVLAFSMTYGWIILLSFVYRENISTPLYLSVILSLFFPLMGLFNILIYTRPQLVAYRRLHRDTSWPTALWRVLKAGGENPDAAPSSTSALHVRQSSTCCKGRFCRRKHEKMNRKIATTNLRLRALYDERMIPPPLDTLQQHGIKEPCSSGRHSIERRISMTSDHAEHEREDCEEEPGSQSSNSKDHQTLNLTVTRDIHFMSSQKDIISKAFQKAAERAKAMNTVDSDAKRMNDLSESSENRSNSEWSHGVYLGSVSRSSVDIELDNDASLEFVDQVESQKS